MLSGSLRPALRLTPPLLLALPLTAQDPAPPEEAPDAPEELRAEPQEPIATTVVTAERQETEAFETPFTTDVIPREQLDRRSYRTTPQVLRDTPGVMIQETAVGQGSPYIRGFTGFLNLFLIDGIRLNNSVFRSGPNQYWATVDPFSIDRLEIVKGPSSVLYGSDAVGGTVNALTKSPYGYGDGLGAAGMAYYRVSSAEESHIARLESSITSGNEWGLLAGVTVKHFGDYQAGRDLGTQPNTGYDEWGANLKLERWIDDDARLVFGYQHVDQNDVPRTHRTVFSESWEGTTVGSDLKRDLDQTRDLAYVQLHDDDVNSWIDRYSLSLSWHGQEEERDRITGSGSPRLQGFEVGTLGLLASFGSDTDIGRLTYGVDAYHDDVDSFSSTEPVQGPIADDATYDLVGVYLQNEIQASERLTLTLGGRLDYASVDAGSVLDPVTDLETSIEDDWSAFVGSARFLYRVTEETLNLYGGISQGFRAPNLSDLTRLDSAKTNEFEVPSPGLDPEYYTQFELGVRTQGERLAAEATVFYTDIEDGIVRVPTGDTTTEGEFIVTKENVGDGYVYGIEVGAAYDVAERWTVFGNGTFLEGKQDTFPTSDPVAEEEYLTRLMPLTLQAGVAWEDAEEGLWAEFVTRYAGEADKLSPSDESDTSRVPPGGTPAYVVFDLRGGCQITESLGLQAAVENIADEDYRIHGSGQNMPGRNFIFSVTYRP
ncbi:MAG: TonB-dependent receptor [Planctomycetota bacterium]